MSKRETGRYESTSAGGEQVQAFVPHTLPPTGPPVLIEGELAERVRAAEQALVRLELAGEMVPSLDWFIYALRAQGGGALLPDRGHAGDASWISSTSRPRGDGRPAERGRRGGLQLPRRARPSPASSSPTHRGAALDASCSTRPTGSCCEGSAARTSSPARCVAARTGSEAAAPAMPPSCRPPPNALRRGAVGVREATSTPKATNCRRWSARVCSTCSSRPSIPTSTATAASGALLVTLLLEHWRLLTRTAALPQPLLQAPPAGVLPPPQRGARRRRLGGVDWTSSSTAWRPSPTKPSPPRAISSPW
jgi:hypothetical protein